MLSQLGGVPHGIAVLDEVPDGSGGAGHDVGLTGGDRAPRLPQSGRCRCRYRLIVDVEPEHHRLPERVESGHGAGEPLL